MIASIHKKQSSLSYKTLCGFVALTFFTGVILPPTPVSAQAILNLPVPGTMVGPSAGFMPLRLIGVTVHPENPLEFDFIVNSGDTNLSVEVYKEESRKLIKYFLASLTVPEDEPWVNLSPYEKDRMIPEGLGQTEMGRDMLAQDYLLKQLTASLMYPEKELGKKFWDKIYKQAREKYGTTEIPVNTFNKVWVVPQEAVVYEKGTSAYVVKSRLKVMLEQDYVAMQHNPAETPAALFPEGKPEGKQQGLEVTGDLVTAQIIREVIVPAIEQEINEGANFANLRQMYNSLILAAWYKLKLKDGLLAKVYVDQNKTKGIDTDDKKVNQRIYDQYIESFQKGVYNYIKEDTDPATQDVIPRKYFSGGLRFGFGKGITAMVAASLMIWGTSLQPAQAAELMNEIKSGKNNRIEVVLGENPLKSVQETVIALEPSLAIASSPVKKGKGESTIEKAKQDTNAAETEKKRGFRPMSQKAKIAAMLRHKVAPGGQLIPAVDPSRRDQMIKEVNINLRKQIVGGLTRQTEFIMVIGELIPTFQDADLNLRFARLIMPSLDRPVGIAEFHPAAYKNFLTVVLQTLNKLLPAIQEESFKQELGRKMMEGRRLVIQLSSEIAAQNRQEEAKKTAVTSSQTSRGETSSSPVLSGDIQVARKIFEWRRGMVDRALDQLPEEVLERLKDLDLVKYDDFMSNLADFKKNARLTIPNDDEILAQALGLAYFHTPNTIYLSIYIDRIMSLNQPDIQKAFRPLAHFVNELLKAEHSFLNVIIDQYTRFLASSTGKAAAKPDKELLVLIISIDGQKYRFEYAYKRSGRTAPAQIIIKDPSGKRLFDEPFGEEYVSQAIFQLAARLMNVLEKTKKKEDIGAALKMKLEQVKETYESLKADEEESWLKSRFLQDFSAESDINQNAQPSGERPATSLPVKVTRQMQDILFNPSHHGSAPGMPGATEFLIWKDDLSAQDERAHELISEMAIALDLPIRIRNVVGNKELYVGLPDSDDIDKIITWLAGKEENSVFKQDIEIIARIHEAAVTSTEDQPVLIWIGEPGSEESRQAYSIVMRIMAEKKEARVISRNWAGLEYLYMTLPYEAYGVDARGQLIQVVDEMFTLAGMLQGGASSSPVEQMVKDFINTVRPLNARFVKELVWLEAEFSEERLSALRITAKEILSAVRGIRSDRGDDMAIVNAVADVINNKTNFLTDLADFGIAPSEAPELRKRFGSFQKEFRDLELIVDAGELSNIEGYHGFGNFVNVQRLSLLVLEKAKKIFDRDRVSVSRALNDLHDNVFRVILAADPKRHKEFEEDMHTFWMYTKQAAESLQSIQNWKTALVERHIPNALDLSREVERIMNTLNIPELNEELIPLRESLAEFLATAHHFLNVLLDRHARIARGQNLLTLKLKSNNREFSLSYGYEEDGDYDPLGFPDARPRIVVRDFMGVELLNEPFRERYVSQAIFELNSTLSDVLAVTSSQEDLANSLKRKFDAIQASAETFAGQERKSLVREEFLKIFPDGRAGGQGPASSPVTLEGEEYETNGSDPKIMEAAVALFNAEFGRMETANISVIEQEYIGYLKDERYLKKAVTALLALNGRISARPFPDAKRAARKLIGWKLASENGLSSHSAGWIVEHLEREEGSFEWVTQRVKNQEGWKNRTEQEVEKKIEAILIEARRRFQYSGVVEETALSVLSNGAGASASSPVELFPSYDHIKEVFRGLHANWHIFEQVLDSRKGTSGREGIGYHSYEHGIENAYLAYLVGKARGYSSKRLLELVVAAALHDYHPRKSGELPQVSETLRLLRQDTELIRVLAALDVDINVISLLIERTDHPWTEAKARQFEENLSKISGTEMESVRTLAELLQLVDKAETFISLDELSFWARTDGLYRFEKKTDATPKEIAEGSETFLDKLKQDPQFDLMLNDLPSWARANLRKNEEFLAEVRLGQRSPGGTSVSPATVKVARDMLDIVKNPDLYGVTSGKGADIVSTDQSILVSIQELGSPESEQAHEIVQRLLREKAGNFTVSYSGGPIYLHVTLTGAADPRAELRQWLEEFVAFAEIWGSGSASSPVKGKDAHKLSGPLMAKLKSLKEKEFEYGLHSGSVSRAEVPLYEGLKNILSGIPVGDEIANTLVHMKEGDLEMLEIYGVLQEGERNIIVAKDADALNELSFSDKRAFAARLRKLAESYERSGMSAFQKKRMLNRLAPLEVVEALSAYFDVSRGVLITIIITRPNYPLWLFEASPKAEEIKGKVHGKGNAWGILMKFGLKEIDQWVTGAKNKVAQIKERVGGEPNAWRIVIAHDIGGTDRWIDRMEPRVRKLAGAVGIPQRSAWTRFIQGTADRGSGSASSPVAEIARRMLDRIRDRPAGSLKVVIGDGNIEEFPQAYILVLRMTNALGSIVSLSPPNQGPPITVTFSSPEDVKGAIRWLEMVIDLENIQDPRGASPQASDEASSSPVEEKIKILEEVLSSDPKDYARTVILNFFPEMESRLLELRKELGFSPTENAWELLRTSPRFLIHFANDPVISAIYNGQISGISRYPTQYAFLLNLFDQVVDKLAEEYRKTGKQQIVSIGVVGAGYGQEPLEILVSAKQRLQQKGISHDAVEVKVSVYSQSNMVYQRVKNNTILYPFLDVSQRWEKYGEFGKSFLKETEKGVVRSEYANSYLQFYDVDLLNPPHGEAGKVDLLLVHNVLQHVDQLEVSGAVARRTMEYLDNLIKGGGFISVIPSDEFNDILFYEAYHSVFHGPRFVRAPGKEDMDFAIQREDSADFFFKVPVSDSVSSRDQGGGAFYPEPGSEEGPGRRASSPVEKLIRDFIIKASPRNDAFYYELDALSFQFSPDRLEKLRTIAGEIQSVVHSIQGSGPEDYAVVNIIRDVLVPKMAAFVALVNSQKMDQGKVPALRDRFNEYRVEFDKLNLIYKKKKIRNIAAYRDSEKKNLQLPVEWQGASSSPVKENRVQGTGARGQKEILRDTSDEIRNTVPGGIDLNPALLDLQIKRDGNGVPLPLPQQPIDTMRIDGFVPIIINITPIPSLPMLLGLVDTEPDTQQTKPDLKARELEVASYLN